MADKERQGPKVTVEGKARQLSRDAQRAAALRANLQRRKAQARERIDDAEQPPKGPGDA